MSAQDDLMSSRDEESSGVGSGKRPKLGISESEKQKLMKFNENAKMLIIMVGKPSRKTRIAGKVQGYLSWLGYKCTLIKASEYRLNSVGLVNDEFFNPENTEYTRRREEYNARALDDAINQLKNSEDVVILDSAHHTKKVGQAKAWCFNLTRV